MFLAQLHPTADAALPLSALKPLFKGIGTVTFADCLLETMNHAAVFDHCTVYEFDGAKPPSLVGVGSYGPKQRVLRSTHAYVGGLHQAEPVRRAMPELGQQLLVRYHEQSELPHCDWRHVCYEAVAINDRLSVAAKIDDAHCFVANFFRDVGRGTLTTPDLERVCSLAFAIAMAGRQHVRLTQATTMHKGDVTDSHSTMADFEQLSDRENQVCKLIASGWSATEIAQQLHVLESSIGTYRKRAYAKLGVGSKRELTQRYRAQAQLRKI